MTNPQQGKRRRRRDSETLSVTRLATFTEAEKLLLDWRELYSSSSSRNPFASPDWLLPWARHFVDERDLAILAVRRDDELVGVAPWYFKRSRALPRRLQLLGSGRHDALTELPQVLTAPGEARPVLRAVMTEWARDALEWDWLELPILEEQGWFEPDWVGGPVLERGVIQHKITRPAVVLELPADVAGLQHGLKRNLTESLRRARNRLGRSGLEWTVTVHAGEDDIRRALPDLFRLHAARSDLAGRRHHPDVLADQARRAFLADALGGMAHLGQARILTLDVAGDPVAAQLVLLAPNATFIGMSGVSPDWWHASPVTLLQWHAAQAAVETGHAEFNLSVGPSVAKLRWSEHIRQHPEFLVCGPRRSSLAAYTAYRMAAAAASVRREAVRHRTQTKS
jgi:CelD/BcsL family acetyltransferase involved in cellulose biosynthesis